MKSYNCFWISHGSFHRFKHEHRSNYVCVGNNSMAFQKTVIKLTLNIIEKYEWKYYKKQQYKKLNIISL